MTGFTIWLTGLSGSGKTTIATSLKNKLLNSYILDGDILRTGLNSDLGFSEEDRRENIRRVGEVAALLSDAGIISICSFISPYESDRDMCRKVHARKNIKFFEVFVNAPFNVCEKRDPKGLYKMAQSGKIKNFTGIDSPYEEPRHPDLKLDTHLYGISECVDRCINMLKNNGIKV